MSGNYVNRYDISGENSKRGFTAESVFVDLMNKNFRVVPSSRMENMRNHIDYYVYDESGKYFTVDVKAKKKYANDREVWVEFKNEVGKGGWLYGKATVIAFEREKDFVIVSREKLKDLCEQKVDLNNKTKNKFDCLYKSYSKENRNDVISKILFEDILNNINCTKISKPCSENI
jgi:hypothetical protein